MHELRGSQHLPQAAAGHSGGSPWRLPRHPPFAQLLHSSIEPSQVDEDPFARFAHAPATSAMFELETAFIAAARS